MRFTLQVGNAKKSKIEFSRNHWTGAALFPCINHSPINRKNMKLTQHLVVAAICGATFILPFTGKTAVYTINDTTADAFPD